MELSLQQAISLGALMVEGGHLANHLTAPYFLRYYVQARQKDLRVMKQLDAEQISAVVYWAALPSIETSFSIPDFKHVQFPTLPKEEWYLPMETYIGDMVTAGVSPHSLIRNAQRSLVGALAAQMGIEKAGPFLQQIGQGWEDFADGTIFPRMTLVHSEPQSKVEVTSPPAAQEYVNASVLPPQGPPNDQSARIDEATSRYVDEYFPTHRFISPADGYQRFEESIAQGLYPRPEVIGRLINYMGRLKELEKVKFLYHHAQVAIDSMGERREQQSLAWFQVEDQMVIAWAHAGESENAYLHRDRILANGGTPSADAYGALIATIKDTTDDVQSALLLWNESQARGVRPNLYLYNTVISRLAKARKADHAIELFQRMKTHVEPSTVTYGAIITACCRVGDAESAEALFEEMMHSKKYQPRVPPFNTLIQLFTTTKPDRTKVEHYYNLMKKQGVAPSEHTYKVRA
jgi:pentatricopeptide repeat protein